MGPRSTFQRDLSKKLEKPKTSRGIGSLPGDKEPAFLTFDEVVPRGKAKNKYKRRVRTNRKKLSFESRADFAKYVPHLPDFEPQYLDQLRDDLQESIERVIRVQHRFVEVLNEHAHRSERVKHIAKAIGEIPFQCELQRKIISKGVLEILQSKERLAKACREEEKKRKKEDHDANCFSCFACKNY